MQRREFLRAAKRVLRRVERGDFPRWGLCYAIRMSFPRVHRPKTGEFNRALGPLFRIWEEFSGDYSYPVPSYDPERTPEGAYWNAVDHYYTGPYGEARIRLLRHIITELEK